MRLRHHTPGRIVFLAGLVLACRGERKPADPARATLPAMSDYREPRRPQFHFSPAQGWMNDPNGLVQYAGTWHLFYQYYPDSTVWGPMHWGHATSTDLVHWSHRPIALAPDSLGYIFSGSAVFDSANTSGLGTSANPPLVAMYTYHDMAAEQAGRLPTQSQAIAFSVDSGRTWTKYAGNPVIPNPGGVKDFRDPKVVRDEAHAQWVVALAVGDHAELWGSANLIQWKKLSEFGAGLGSHEGVWECPDFFPMRVEGRGEARWVLLQSLNPGHPNGGSGTQYFVGDFDGTTFRAESAGAPGKDGALWLDHGRDNYAGVTWANAPAGRRVFIGWMSNWSYAQRVPTGTWRSALTVPRDLTLHRTPEGYRLFSQPVPELAMLRGDARTEPAGPLEGVRAVALPDTVGPALLELTLAVDVPKGSRARVGVELANDRKERYRVGYDAAARTYFSDRTAAGLTDFSPDFAPTVSTAPRIADGEPVTLHLFLDAASAELFADGGATTMTEVFFPSAPFDHVSVFSEGGAVRVRELRVTPLRRAW